MKNYLLITILFLFIATSCQTNEPAPPAFDKGKQATTEEEMREMIVGSWGYVYKETGITRPGELVVLEFLKDTRYRYGSTIHLDYSGGELDTINNQNNNDEGTYFYNYSDSIFYSIKGGEYLILEYLGFDSLNDFKDMPRKITLYKNYLILNDRGYDEMYEKI